MTHRTGKHGALDFIETIHTDNIKWWPGKKDEAWIFSSLGRKKENG